VPLFSARSRGDSARLNTTRGDSVLGVLFQTSSVPYPQAPESISALAKVPGVQLVCVTSNPQENSDAFTEAKGRWLRRHILAMR
jgi:hypothetical protein